MSWMTARTPPKQKPTSGQVKTHSHAWHQREGGHIVFGDLVDRVVNRPAHKHRNLLVLRKRRAAQRRAVVAAQKEAST